MGFVKRPRSWLLGLGVAICLGVPLAIEFWLRRPVGEGPAGPEVNRAGFQSVWDDRPVLLLGLGDSVTRGLGARSPNHSYFGRLHKNPEDEFEQMKGVSLGAVLPGLTTLNLALSGSTSLEHENIIDDQLEIQDEETFGIVVMTTGGNDLIHSYGRMAPKEGAMYGASLEQAEPWIQSFEKRLSGMLERITECFPAGCEIYLGDIYDPTDGVGDAVSIYLPRWEDGLAIHARYNEVIRMTAAQWEHVHVVPIHETFLGHGSHCRQFWRAHYDAEDPHYWFWDNVEDPNTRGYDALRRVFLNQIAAHSRLRPRE